MSTKNCNKKGFCHNEIKKIAVRNGKQENKWKVLRKIYLQQMCSSNQSSAATNLIYLTTKEYLQ